MEISGEKPHHTL